jgi:hypothetical protein
MILLSINIPTFERLESFSQIILELENELTSLPNELRSLIDINVFDNNSPEFFQKNLQVIQVSERSRLQIKISKNSHNIGGDENIFKCCIENKQSVFTWVLGDDDHIVSGSLIKIISLLVEHQNDLGLLILSDTTYHLDEGLLNKKIDSYHTFVRLAVTLQPHVLIAHTLISANIFRTELFNEDESKYVTRDLTTRLNLSANFSHMRGLVKGLLSNLGKNYCVITPAFTALDTSKRLPSAVNFDSDILNIYYFYFLWLASETGIHLSQVARHDSVSWLFDH